MVASQKNPDECRSVWPVFLVFVASAFGQTDRDIITGTVQDPGGALISRPPREDVNCPSFDPGQEFVSIRLLRKILFWLLGHRGFVTTRTAVVPALKHW